MLLGCAIHVVEASVLNANSALVGYSIAYPVLMQDVIVHPKLLEYGKRKLPQCLPAIVQP